MPYKTKQRELIAGYFKENTDRQFSINDISDRFSESIGKSTVYREVSRLAEEGFVRKYPDSEGGFWYQYAGEHCHEHFHLRCISCGRIVHLDCHLMNDVCRHINSEHDFEIDMSRTVLYGVCGKCKNNRED